MWRLIPVQSKVGEGTHIDSSIGGGGGVHVIGSNTIRHTYFCYWRFISFCENSTLSHVTQIGLFLTVSLLLVLFHCSMILLHYFNLYLCLLTCHTTCDLTSRLTLSVKKWDASMKMRAYSGCMFGLTYYSPKTSLPVSSSCSSFSSVEYSGG